MAAEDGSQYYSKHVSTVNVCRFSFRPSGRVERKSPTQEVCIIVGMVVTIVEVFCHGRDIYFFESLYCKSNCLETLRITRKSFLRRTARTFNSFEKQW